MKGITGWGPNGQELEGVGVKVKSQRSPRSWLLRLGWGHKGVDLEVD